MDGVKLIDCKLKQWGCSVKGRLKLLDAFCLRFQHKGMFHRRQGNKIADSIIGFNSIKMVDNPTLRQWLAMSLFPDQNMFFNSIAFCSRMARAVNPHIAVFIKRTTTFPIRTFFPLLAYITFIQTANADSPSPFLFTNLASRSLEANYIPTIHAIIYRISLAFLIPRFFNGATSAFGSIARSRFSTDNTYSHSTTIIPCGVT